jgi:hypothetical protein
MRLRVKVIGARNLFDTTPGALDEGCCDRAGVGRRGHHRTAAATRRPPPRPLTEQLQAALRSRVLIEQAKGVLAEGSTGHGRGVRGAARQPPQPQPAPVRSRPGRRRWVRADSTATAISLPADTPSIRPAFARQTVSAASVRSRAPRLGRLWWGPGGYRPVPLESLDSGAPTACYADPADSYQVHGAGDWSAMPGRGGRRRLRVRPWGRLRRRRRCPAVGW